MASIVIVAEGLTFDSPAVRYAASIARQSGDDVRCLYLAPAVTSTAEWIERLPPRKLSRLKHLRATHTTTEWVHVQEELIREQMKSAAHDRAELQKQFRRIGIPLSCQRIEPSGETLLEALREYAPVKFLIAGRLRLPADLVKQGIMTIEDLGRHIGCEAIDAMAMGQWLARPRRRLWFQLTGYGAITVLMFFIVFFHFGGWNHVLMRGGLLPATAIMLTSALAAWCWGRTIEILLKLTKVDIYGS